MSRSNVSDESAAAARDTAERHRTLFPQRLRSWVGRITRSVDHAHIRKQIEADGVFSHHYAFMIAISAGIAGIGLLLNSPAVIIGAMLMSPLMGPMVATGFAIAMVDTELGRRSFGAVVAGAIMAVVVTTAIVLLSPVQDATPEILVRTRPNLFDLVVAILSGAAGGYATVRGRGGTVVGVAIATALMPPLAVVGYGIATHQWPIARGAALLFVTNMVAIITAAALVAEWYGFGRGGIRKAFARQALVSLVLLVPLTFPLFISLKAIAQQSYAQAVIRKTIGAHVSRLEDGQLARLQVEFSEANDVRVDAIVMTESPEGGLRDELQAAIEKELGRPVRLKLSQVRAEEGAVKAGSGSFARLLEPASAPPSSPQPSPTLAEEIRAGATIPLRSVESDEQARTVTILAGAHPAFDMFAYRAMEAELAARHGDWKVRLVPPIAPLPVVQFEAGSDTLSEDALSALETAAWALAAWEVDEVLVTGHASTERSGTRALAVKRAKRVGQWLQGQGLQARASARYPLDKQRDLELRLGRQAFRVVVLTPSFAAEPYSGFPSDRSR